MGIKAKLDTIIAAKLARAKQVIDKVVVECGADMIYGLSTPYPPASLPGEKPHKRTGLLRSSTVMEDAVIDGLTVVGSVSNDCEYAKHLEHGTTRMDPRPFIEPLRQKWIPICEDRLRAAVGAK